MTRFAPARMLAGLAALAAAVAGPLVAPAHAALGLSKVIVDLRPDAPPRDDIELWNEGSERLYVVVEPAEVTDPGQPGEGRRASPDPAETGLLVTPQKLVLEPNERKLVRIAAVAERPRTDRVYRVTIKPVAGPVTAEQTALKVFVGYAALVLYRPEVLDGTVTGTRKGRQLVLRNAGNTNVELAQGRQCAADGTACRDLGSTRLYAGAEWTVALPYDTVAEFTAQVGDRSTKLTF